jgi:hypothetical protein
MRWCGHADRAGVELSRRGIRIQRSDEDGDDKFKWSATVVDLA